jgi:TolA-binding protein
MKRSLEVTSRDVEAVIERGRLIRQAPDVVRARLMARARTAVAGARTAPLLALPVAAAPPNRRLRFAVAAALLLASAGAGAAAALHVRAPSPNEDGAIDAAPPPRRSKPARALAAGEPTPAPRSRLARAHRPISPHESYAAELKLLQRAQSAYARQDFSDALALVAEHARQFPAGRLAEEREALRVRSLVGTGHGDQARAALSGFARRFPHSVLLSRLQAAVYRSGE